MLITALFTKSVGDPATGLTLTDIDLYLYRRTIADGTMATIWNGENPTEEIGGGQYSKNYASEDTATYTYHAYSHYTGATTLDSDYSLQGSPMGAPTESETADAVHDEVVESTLTLRQIVRVMLAVLAGKASGGGTDTVTFRDYADGKNRVTATVTTDGDRTAITLDGT